MTLAMIAVAAVGILGWLVMRTRRAESISFDRFQGAKPVDREPTARTAVDHLGELVEGWDLVERDTGFFGLWKETRIDGIRVSFQGNPESLSITAGEFDADEEQLADSYLAVATADRPLPAEGSGQRLDRYVGPAGQALAGRFYLCATGRKSYPELNVAEVRRALMRLSESVAEVLFYESGGFELSAGGATPETVRNDVREAVAIAGAIAKKTRD